MSEEFICKLCRHIAPLELNKKEEPSEEIILRRFFVTPGLVYSIWRCTGNCYGCPDFGNPGMVPKGSHLGNYLLTEGKRSIPELAGTKV